MPSFRAFIRAFPSNNLSTTPTEEEASAKNAE